MNNKNIGSAIPLTRRTRSTFRVGVNSRGFWVALDQGGRCGGLFARREDAIRFALSQNGNRPEEIQLVESSLDLDLQTA